MKKIIIILFLLLPLFAFADNSRVNVYFFIVMTALIVLRKRNLLRTWQKKFLK